jgi:2,4-dienoyl-CoA reductase-like NADH-dependent reductase (Old Yellow Enzyme family)/thioredoxin reductase
MRKYPAIFSSGKIGRLTLKNRIVMPPMGTSLASMSGELTTNIIEYYKERAKGGVGLIIVEVSEINYENGSSALNSVRVDTSRCVPQMRRLAEAVHVYDTKIFTQLHHGGNQAARIFNDGHEPVSASDVKCEALADRPRALSNSEVKEYIQKYIFSASMAKLAHYDGVEIHAAHGYLPCQFFDPHTNRRTDEYGGSFENRMRFATEIIQGIKAACGSDFPVSVRISVDMFTSHGYGLEEGVKIAKAMEAAGADAINCSFGNYESFPASVETASFEQGWRVYMAEAVKKAVNVPVIAVGTLREPEYIEKILEENKTDFVAIGRGLIADPEWCNKAQQGREKEIRKCISCLTCLYNVLGCGIVCCAINARAGHEAEYPKPLKDGNGRKVVVVGGGPAGIEAARICALRGFNVVLFEKGPALGGQLQLAKKALHQERINWFIEYATNEMDRLGVDVRLDCAVTANTICKENPYAVYIATGGMPSIPNVAGVNKSNVITAEDYLSGKITLTNEKAVIIGGGITGGETAVLIAANGGKATVVEMLCSICTDMYPDSRTDIIHDMEKYGVNVLTNSMLMEIKDNAVILKDVTTDETKEISADKVIIATGVKPVNALYDELADEMEYIYTLGDAMHQGKIIDAVKTAHVRALDLE